MKYTYNDRNQFIDVIYNELNDESSELKIFFDKIYNEYINIYSADKNIVNTKKEKIEDYYKKYMEEINNYIFKLKNSEIIDKLLNYFDMNSILYSGVKEIPELLLYDKSQDNYFNNNIIKTKIIEENTKLYEELDFTKTKLKYFKRRRRRMLFSWDANLTEAEDKIWHLSKDIEILVNKIQTNNNILSILKTIDIDLTNSEKKELYKIINHINNYIQNFNKIDMDLDKLHDTETKKEYMLKTYNNLISKNVIKKEEIERVFTQLQKINYLYISNAFKGKTLMKSNADIITSGLVDWFIEDIFINTFLNEKNMKVSKK